MRKPLLGREGANITLHTAGWNLLAARLGEEGFVYQEFAPLTNFDGRCPVVGSCLVRQELGNAAAAIGTRESDTPITDNFSQFAPALPSECGPRLTG